MRNSIENYLKQQQDKRDRREAAHRKKLLAQQNRLLQNPAYRAHVARRAKMRVSKDPAERAEWLATRNVRFNPEEKLP